MVMGCDQNSAVNAAAKTKTNSAGAEASDAAIAGCCEAKSSGVAPPADKLPSSAGDLSAILYQSFKPETHKLGGNGDDAILLRAMQPEDFNTVRQLLPNVSGCSESFSSDQVKCFFAIPTFHPVCAMEVATNRLVAYAELVRLPHFGRGFDARIERVTVAQDFRGRGLGTLLCDYLIRQAKDSMGCGRIDLTVEKSDARHIYEDKFEFSPVDTTVMRRKFRPGG